MMYNLVMISLCLQVCAFYEHPISHGRVAVLGSAHMFSDQYIDREENNKIKDVIFKFLTAKDFKLNQIDADDPEVLYIWNPWWGS